MSGQLAVLGLNRPAIRQDLDRVNTHIDHRLYRDDHTALQANAVARFAVVRNLRALMQRSAYAVTDVVAHDRKAVGLDVSLNGCADIRYAVALTGKFNAFKEALTCYSDQLFCLFAYLTARNRAGAVAVETADVRTNVNLNDIAFLDNCMLGRNTVDDLVIQRYAGAAWEAAVAEEGRLGAGILNRLADDAVDLPGGNTRLYGVCRRLTRNSGKASGNTHFFKLFFRLDMNHITDPAPLLQTFR